MTFLLSIALLAVRAEASEKTLTLYKDYITKVRCEGKLLLSAIGAPELVALEALPSQVGCGVLLKPLAKSGKTNLNLETSTGSVHLLVEIATPDRRIDSSVLEIHIRSKE